jgi:hypothetical protein
MSCFFPRVALLSLRTTVHFGRGASVHRFQNKSNRHSTCKRGIEAHSTIAWLSLVSIQDRCGSFLRVSL